MEITSVNYQQAVSETMPVHTSTAARDMARGDYKNTTGAETNSNSGKRQTSQPEVEAQKIVEKVNQHVERFTTKVGFSYNEEYGRAVIVVTDRETGEVIRKIPAEEMLELLSKLDEVAGIIFNEQV